MCLYVNFNGLQTFEKLLHENPDKPIPELLNETFVKTDAQLAEKKGLFSGCTAVVAFLRYEERDDDNVNDDARTISLSHDDNDILKQQETKSNKKIRQVIFGYTYLILSLFYFITTLDLCLTYGLIQRVLQTAKVGDARAVLRYAIMIQFKLN